MRANSVYEDMSTSTEMVLRFKTGERLEIVYGKLTEEIQAHAMRRGVKDMVVDCMAIPCDIKTGKSACLIEKISAARAKVERLKSGELGGGARGAGGSDVEAAMVAFPKWAALGRKATSEWLKGKTESEREFLFGLESFKKARAAIVARMGADVDVASLLAEIGNDESDVEQNGQEPEPSE